ncbi:hypothetical protein, partial [Nocardia sp. SC052]|uniref:hypothetical protein n=1 Tax=Nocardia sichangensis TaxID=3385975 RepID=UPI00399FB990
WDANAPRLSRPSTASLDPAAQDRANRAALNAYGRDISTARERAIAAGLSPEQAESELENAQERAKVSASISIAPTEPGGSVRVEHSWHATEAEAAAWADRRVRTIPTRPGAQMRISLRERGVEVPKWFSEGGREHVTTATRELAEGHDRDQKARTLREQVPQASATERARDEQQLPASVQRVAAERDQLAEDLAQRGREIEQLSGDLVDAAERNNELRNRHRLSIEHNNELTEANARLTRQLTAITAERDQLRGERDEAVAKLAERTPAHERYGSPERQAEQAGAEAASNGHTNGRTPIKGHAFAGLVNGRNRDREMEMEL